MRVCLTSSFSAVESIRGWQRKARTEIQCRRPVLFHLPLFCRCQKGNPISNPYAKNPRMNSSTYKSTRLSTCSESGLLNSSQIPRLAIAGQECAHSSQTYISPIGAARDEAASGASANSQFLLCHIFSVVDLLTFEKARTLIPTHKLANGLWVE